MTHLRRGVDELEVDLFQRGALGVHQQRLTEGNDTALGSNAAALDHQEIVIDLTIEWETTHRSDGLVRQIVLGGSAVLNDLIKSNEKETIMISYDIVFFECDLSVLVVNGISPIIMYTWRFIEM